MCCCSGALLGIPAIITGHVSRGRIKSSGGTLTGGGVALGGLITGYISIALTILFAISLVPNWPTIKAGITATIGLSGIRTAATQTESWPADEGITSAKEYIATLITRKGLTKETADLIDLKTIEIGNVSGSDPGTTIIARTRPGVFQDGLVFEMLKDGTLTFAGGTTTEKGTPPPREPQFLAD